jgi:hypothetical protein
MIYLNLFYCFMIICESYNIIILNLIIFYLNYNQYTNSHKYNIFWNSTVSRGLSTNNNLKSSQLSYQVSDFVSVFYLPNTSRKVDCPFMYLVDLSLFALFLHKKKLYWDNWSVLLYDLLDIYSSWFVLLTKNASNLIFILSKQFFMSIFIWQWIIRDTLQEIGKHSSTRNWWIYNCKWGTYSKFIDFPTNLRKEFHINKIDVNYFQVHVLFSVLQNPMKVTLRSIVSFGMKCKQTSRND